MSLALSPILLRDSGNCIYIETNDIISLFGEYQDLFQSTGVVSVYYTTAMGKLEVFLVSNLESPPDSIESFIEEMKVKGIDIMWGNEEDRQKRSVWVQMNL